jgi:hypothetical protein
LGSWVVSVPKLPRLMADSNVLFPESKILTSFRMVILLRTASDPTYEKIFQFSGGFPFLKNKIRITVPVPGIQNP